MNRSRGLIGLLLLAGCKSPPSPPGETVDLGPVFYAAQPTIRHTFSVVNQRDRTVRLLGESHSCVCTEVELKRGELRPGESTPLSLTVRVPPEYGRRGISCSIRTDDPDFPVWTYRITFEAFPEARVVPPQEKLGSLRLADTPGPARPICLESTLEVFSRDDGDVPSVERVTTTEGLRVRVGDRPLVDPLRDGIRRVRYPVRVELTPHDSLSDVVSETYAIALTNGGLRDGDRGVAFE